jgi:predicted nuclease with TOPRIM domain
MQALLPPPKNGTKDSETKSPELSSAAQSNNSKAAKVESAIEYIKQLKKQCSEKDELLSKKDEEMVALRKQLDELKKGAPASSADATTQEVKEKSAGQPDEDRGNGVT